MSSKYPGKQRLACGQPNGYRCPRQGKPHKEEVPVFREETSCSPGTRIQYGNVQMSDVACKVDGGLLRISFLCSVVEFVFILKIVGKPLKDFK